MKTVSRLVLSIQAYYKVNSRCSLISLLFRIVSSLNHIDLPLFMINKVNVTLFRQFLRFYSLFKCIILLNLDVFLI